MRRCCFWLPPPSAPGICFCRAPCHDAGRLQRARRWVRGPRKYYGSLPRKASRPESSPRLAGLILAELTIRFLVKWSPADIPRLSDASLHIESFAFAAIAALLRCVCCSILPGLASHAHKSGSRASRRRRPNLDLTNGRRNPERFSFYASGCHRDAAGGRCLAVDELPRDDDSRHGLRNRDALSMSLALARPGTIGSSSLRSPGSPRILLAAPGSSSRSARCHIRGGGSAAAV